jgi:hypothetical protein
MDKVTYISHNITIDLNLPFLRSRRTFVYDVPMVVVIVTHCFINNYCSHVETGDGIQVYVISDF